MRTKLILAAIVVTLMLLSSGAAAVFNMSAGGTKSSHSSANPSPISILDSFTSAQEKSSGNSASNSTSLSGTGGVQPSIQYANSVQQNSAMPLYTVNLTESGLPTGTLWEITVNGSVFNSRNPSIMFPEMNGTYNYSIQQESMFVPESPAGTFSVSGNSISASVHFVGKPYVRYTLNLQSGYISQGNSTGSSRANPSFAAFDPNNGLLYVSDSYNNQVVAIDGNNVIVSRINVGSGPAGIAFDPLNNMIYVANSQSGNVSVINQRNSLAATVTAGSSPYGVAFDPANGLVYVTNVNSGNITLIDSHNSVAGQIITGGNPFDMAYDSNNGFMYATDPGSNFIYKIGGNNAVSSKIRVSSGPTGIAFDNATGEMYVADIASNQLSVVNSTTGSVAVIQEILNPYYIIYDPINQLVYISNPNSNAVTVVSPNTLQVIDRISTGTGPFGMAFDSLNNDVYIADYNSGTLSILGQEGALHSIRFVESGLASGTQWGVTLNNYSVESYSGAIVFNETDGSYNYTLKNVSGYEVNQDSGILIISGSSQQVSVKFGKLYRVTIAETGLPEGTSWAFSVDSMNNSTTLAAVNCYLPDGTYSLSVQGVKGYQVKNSNFTIEVNGGNVTFTVVFSKTYFAVLRETGLPGGTSWYAEVNGSMAQSTGRSISFPLTNGTYVYYIPSINGYSPSTPSGSVVISGSNASVGVAFHREKYSVTFTETGLLRGVEWAITVNGTTTYSTGNSLSFSQYDGNYNYEVAPVEGYFLATPSGNVSVNGSAVNVTIHFSEMFNVTFKESGLQGPVGWSVTLNGKILKSINSSMTFQMLNGTYNYSAAEVMGYYLKNTGGYVTVEGNQVTVNIEYVHLYSVTVLESNLPAGTSWWINLTGQSYVSSSGSIHFNITNGTYSYSTGSSNNSWRSSGGAFTVDGSNITLNLNFNEVVFGIDFTSQGLPPGLEWTVSNGIVQESSSSGQIIFLEPNGTYTFKISPEQGYFLPAYSLTVTVSGHNITKSLGWKQYTYAITFTETGLPAGTPWSVSIGNSSYSGNGAAIAVSLPNGTFHYIIESSDSTYRPVSSTGALTIEGAPSSEEIPFIRVTYPVTFSQSGLPSGTSWSVQINGNTFEGTGSEIIAPLANGTYYYLINPVPGYHAEKYSGTFKVSGTPADVNTTWQQVKYRVTFTDSGLPQGKTWFVNISGQGNYSSSTGTLSLYLPNGSYLYQVQTGYKEYAPVNAVGQLYLDGSSVSVYAPFREITFSVSFESHGLPAGTTWYVNLSNGQSFSSDSGDIAFSEPNGTFLYSISPVSGYHTNVYSSVITVNGSGMLVNVTWNPFLYTVRFTENGLSQGTAWGIIFNGQNVSTATDSLAFRVQNGTYAFTVPPVPGYRESPENGTITVSGSGFSEKISFTRPNNVWFIESGLDFGTNWTVTVNNISESANTNTILFHLSNGTYDFSVSQVHGYKLITNRGDDHGDNGKSTSLIVTVTGNNTIVFLYFVEHSHHRDYFTGQHNFTLYAQITNQHTLDKGKWQYVSGMDLNIYKDSSGQYETYGFLYFYKIRMHPLEITDFRVQWI